MFTSLELYYTETTKPIYRGYLTTRQAVRIEAHKCVQLAQSRHAPTGNRTREFFVASPMPNQWRHYEMQLQIDRSLVTRAVQSGMPGSPVAVRTGASLLG